MAIIHGAGAPPPIMTCNIARKMASEKTNQINNLPGSAPGGIQYCAASPWKPRRQIFSTANHFIFHNHSPFI
ncbi:hypothetical protein [Cupriavidus sp. HPC(L)]|uniref:hypothetical protein n=1 Tax=Cupriavidus sp. HPC(L) TaxID=1217418 RepID=UPI0012EE74A1|nr:hypothetical protein [Cupriavidus sp. HPC(L)]